MSSMFHFLPSFAPDYSGFFSALHGLDGLMVLHDPSGCLGNYVSCDEPRWYHDPRPVFTSLLKEMQAIIGDDSLLIEKVVKAAQTFKPPFICLLTTPVPSLIGFDPRGTALAIEMETGIPAFGVDTTGFPNYETGIAKAMDLLHRHFMLTDTEKKEKSVNILGMTPLDYFIHDQTERMRSVVEGFGWSVNAFVGGGNSLDDVRNARAAEKNIVMCAAALPLAQRMQAEDGIPYWMGPPCGSAGMASLKAFLHDESEEAVLPAQGGKRALIIAEQACANALRLHLQGDKNYGEIAVASFFRLEDELRQPQDVFLKNEAALRRLMKESRCDVIIGDPLFEHFNQHHIPFIPMPHPAVSSRLHWKDTRSLIGPCDLPV